jgi:hypothetical protein
MRRGAPVERRGAERRPQQREKRIKIFRRPSDVRDLVSDPTWNGKDFDMVRLRHALLVFALAAGAFGCAHGGGSHGHDYAHWSIFHCSQCDDFPMPAYGPNGSMVPGSYSGPPSESSPSSSRMSVPTSSNAPVVSPETTVPPPDERPRDAAATPPVPPPAVNP